MTELFKDHFSEGSNEYRIYRPQYPQPLFQYLSQLTARHDYAWDCATGSGQSAIELSKYYSSVIATDASKNQIDNAVATKGISYRVENAEDSTIENESIDVITVAQALHWFDMEKFTEEVIRVLNNQGVLAVWTYGTMDINTDLNKTIEHLYSGMLDSFWPPERMMIENGYRDISFPLEAIDSPAFQMHTEWTLSQLIGYLCTWSAVKKYQEQNGVNPVEEMVDSISSSWGDSNRKIVINWPLILKVWKKIG